MSTIIPPHCVSVQVRSTSRVAEGERLNQRLTLEEFADTPAELVAKHMAIAGGAFAGIMGEMAKFASEVK